MICTPYYGTDFPGRSSSCSTHQPDQKRTPQRTSENVCMDRCTDRGRSTEPFCQGCWYGDSLETILESTGMQDSWLLVLQSQALPSFFPVYGIGWWEARPGFIGRNGCLEHYQTKTGSSPFWRMELVHYSWVNFCAIFHLLVRYIQREYGVPPPQHAYCKKKKKHPRGTLPGGLILVGFTIIYSVVGFIHPSIHPTIHPSSQRDIHPIPSHPIHSIHSIHPSIPIPVWNVQGG